MVKKPQASQPKKSLTHSTLSGLLWNFSGAGIQALLRTIVLLFLARLLSPVDFGLVSAALIVVYFSEIFSQLGIGPAVIQRPVITEDHLRTGFTISTFFGFVLAGGVIALAPVLANFFRMPLLREVLYVLAWVFPMKGVALVAESLLYRELHFRLVATRDVLAYFIGYGGVGIGLAVMGFGVWALVWANLAETAVRTIILLVARPHPKRPLLAFEPLKELVYYGGGFTAGRISNYVAQQGNNFIIGRFLGAEALGLYGRAYTLTAMPVTLAGGVLDKVLFPAMAKMQENTGKLEVIYLQGTALLGLLTLPLSTACVILAPELVDLLLGNAWHEAIVPFQILALGMMFRTSYKIGDALARATGEVYKRATRMALFAVAVLVGSYVGMHWGVSGVCWGVLAALALNFALTAALSLRITGVQWHQFIRMHIAPSLLSLVVLAETYPIAELGRIFGYPAYVIVISSLALGGTTAFLLVIFLPKLFLGAEGLGMIQRFVRYIPPRLNIGNWTQRISEATI